MNIFTSKILVVTISMLTANLIFALWATVQQFGLTELTACLIWICLSSVQFFAIGYWGSKRYRLMEFEKKEENRVGCRLEHSDIEKMGDEELRATVNEVSSLLSKRLQQRFEA